MAQTLNFIVVAVIAVEAILFDGFINILYSIIIIRGQELLDNCGAEHFFLKVDLAVAVEIKQIPHDENLLCRLPEERLSAVHPCNLLRMRFHLRRD